MRSAIIALCIFLSAAAAANAQGWQAFSTGTNADLVAVYFTSSTRGYVGGDAGYLASTIDGGKTWEKYPLNTTEDVSEIYFRNEKNGYVVAGRLMYITDDGGKTWRETRIFRAADYRIGTPIFTSIRFSDKNQGLAIGSIVNKNDDVIDSIVMRTDDGGNTWTRVLVPTKMELIHLDFNGNSHGWIVGDKGVILATVDGGKSWVLQHSGISRGLFSVDFRDDNDGFAVGGGGTIIRTENGGGLWDKVVNPFNTTLKRVGFTDDKNGWAVGFNGIILNTGDKGKTWTKVESGVKVNLYSLFINKKAGCAVGENGTVLIHNR